MKPTQLNQKETHAHQVPALSVKVFKSQDTRYDYLMLLTNNWITTQKHSDDFIRSIN